MAVMIFVVLAGYITVPEFLEYSTSPELESIKIAEAAVTEGLAALGGICCVSCAQLDAGEARAERTSRTRNLRTKDLLMRRLRFGFRLFPLYLF